MATSADTVTLNDDAHGVIETGRGPGHVDIAQAEAAFDELSRQLSKASQAAPRTETTDSIANAKDLEKGGENDEIFDLRDYLASSNDANEQAGIKHKHVGVTWEDLQVDAIGGVDSKVGQSSVSYLMHSLISCEDICENLRECVQLLH
jgi:hypothetical protein